MKPLLAASLHEGDPMTRREFAHWCRVFTGETIRDLRHIREVPRVSMHAWRRHVSAGRPPRDVSAWRVDYRASYDQIRTRKTS